MDSKLVVALDLTDVNKLLEIAGNIAGEVYAIKINWPTIMIQGAGIIRDLSKLGKVICDLKIADIPNTNSMIVENVVKMGAWGVISHSFTGEDSLRAVVKSAGNAMVFSVVSMSHPGSSDFINRHTDELIEVSRRAGVYGLIGPGNNTSELSRIRRLAGSLVLMTPGVGAQGGKASDAIRSGSDLVIVGRAVYNSPDPAEAVHRINMEILESVER